MNRVQSEDPVAYAALSACTGRPAKSDTAKVEDHIIAEALEILKARMRTLTGTFFNSPDSARDFLKLKLREYPYEVFAVIFLNTRHQLLEYVEMFRGTTDGASVHPREVVREAMRLNASAVILAHNHPSGDSTPSQSDLKITRRLQDALALIDVRVLDHMIVGETVRSLAETGDI